MFVVFTYTTVLGEKEAAEHVAVSSSTSR